MIIFIHNPGEKRKRKKGIRRISDEMIQGCVAGLKPQESPFSSTSTSVSWHRKSTEKQCLTIIEMKCERRDRRARFECRNGQHFNNALRRLSWQKFSYRGSQFSSCVKCITHFAQKKNKNLSQRETLGNILYIHVFRFAPVKTLNIYCQDDS